MTFDLGDLRGKFQNSAVAKGIFAKPAKTETVTWEQLVAIFFPLNEHLFESLPKLCTVITDKTKCC